MYYKVRLAKRLTRTIVIKANNDDEAINKIWSKGLDSKYICPKDTLYDFTFNAYDNSLNQNDIGWRYLSNGAYPDEDELISCTTELLGINGCETIEQMNHELSKRTPFGMKIEPVDNNHGVIITGIINNYNEPYKILYFPFFKSEYYDALHDVGKRTSWFYQIESGTPWEHTKEAPSDGIGNLRVMFLNANYNALNDGLDELIRQGIIADYTYVKIIRHPLVYTKEATLDGVGNLRMLLKNADYNALFDWLNELVRQGVIADYKYISKNC